MASLTPPPAVKDKPLLAAAYGLKPSWTPMWMMRQAGRYLPEYRAIRTRHPTLEMFQTPQIAAEITLQPLKRFPLDGAILYADILLIPDALGLGLTFVTNEGPKFTNVVRDNAGLQKIREMASDMPAFLNRLKYVAETLDLVCKSLPTQTTMLGFAGAPFTVASYVIEGGSSHGEFLQTKKLMFKNPEIMHGILEVLTTTTIAYLNMQIDHGAEVVQLFESWGGALTPDQYAEFCAPYSRRILESVEKRIPAIHFVGESAGILPEVLEVPSRVFSVDWRQDLGRVSALTPNRVLQGNLDPLLLHGNLDNLEKRVNTVLKKGRAHPGGYIFNLGHGIQKETPIEHVEKLVEWVHRQP